MDTFVDLYQIQRKAGSSTEGCIGSTRYDRLNEPNRHGCPQFSPLSAEDLLGRALGEGSLVRVTIEILHEEPVSESCINPWYGHWENKKRGATSYLLESCIRDGKEQK